MDDSSVRNQHTGLRVKIDQSRVRQTPKTDFGSVMAEGMKKTAGAVAGAGALAAPFVPGGAILSAAITGVGSIKTTASSFGNASAPNSTPLTGTGSPVSSTVSSSTGLPSAGGAAPTGGGGDLMAEQKSMMAMNQDFNMQYLMLQQKMQSDNRSFSTLSNVMKTKHDTAKNAINNMR